jgi:hypothetical protein
VKYEGKNYFEEGVLTSSRFLSLSVMLSVEFLLLMYCDTDKDKIIPGPVAAQSEA